MNENRLSKHNNLLLSLLSLKKGKIGAVFMDANLIHANLIWVASECLPICIAALLAEMHTSRSDKGVYGKRMLGMGVS
jgi:hypothetical protein